MSALWIATIGAGLVAFTLKYTGHSIPAHLLAHPRIQRINALIPIALLSALVAVQSFTEKSRLMIDHRAAGVSVALVALLLKAPFPVVVLSAAITSAAVYRLF
ncbi:MAG: AzlD domain-containing protein [Candidatus Planktophila sp.]|nr:AzlD domain-containing protein [Candidatus Planktophila sp.]PHX76190.1 MAG: branched-chain amino acid transporter AzlD [Actinomycetota bacterium]